MDDTITRRDFTLQSILALLSGVTIIITDCGGDDSGSPTSPDGGGSSGDAVGVVSANHGHTAVVTAAQLMAGNAVRLDIQGSADHPHTVDLSADEITQIRNRQRVSKTSSTGQQAGQAHSHTVTFN